MRTRSVGVGVLGAWLLAVVAGTAPRAVEPGEPLPPRCEGARALEASLFLIGDAGAPQPGDEPTLRALAALGRARSDALGAERAAVAFLGDNLYPAGLPPPGSPARVEGERRLAAQVDAAREAGLRAWFVPGNHDWDDGGDDGWEAVRRAAAFLEARSDGHAAVIPAGGCPGPARVDLGSRLALVFVDSQWWIHEGPKPRDPDSGCAADTREELVRALAAAAATTAGRHSVVMAHHPLESSGPHALRFDWRDHVFPLLEVHRALWVPIPIVGSVYPLARRLGASPQDFGSEGYEALREDLGRAFEAAPPLLYAAGHDHSLQLLRAGPGQHHLVSGAGSSNLVTRVQPVDGTLYAAAVPGFARLDAYADGAVEIALIEAQSGAPARERFSACLDPGKRAGPAGTAAPRGSASP